MHYKTLMSAPTTELPYGITVEVPPSYRLPGNDRIIPTHTQLFRPELRAAEALQHTYNRNPEVPELHVDFIGCSHGAEVDTTLAEHNRMMPGVPVRARGVDGNLTATEAAWLGRYFLPRRPKYEADLANNLEALREHGFATDFEVVQEVFGIDRAEDYYQVDATPVRANHDVSFTQADLSQGVPLAGQSHLIIAHNVFFFMEPEVATRVASELAGKLSLQGVFWMGDLGPATTASMRMGTSGTNWGTWLPDTAKRFRDEFDLEPIVMGKQDLPVGFARP